MHNSIDLSEVQGKTDALRRRRWQAGVKLEKHSFKQRMATNQATLSYNKLISRDTNFQLHDCAA